MNCSLSFTQQLSVASVAFSVVASVVFSCCVESSTPACGWIGVPVANVFEGASGATVSTGATSALLTILLDAKTLLTETITIAAIAANINFFIILSFFNCYYINVTYFLFCGFIIEPAIHSHNLRAKKKNEIDMG